MPRHASELIVAEVLQNDDPEQAIKAMLKHMNLNIDHWPLDERRRVGMGKDMAICGIMALIGIERRVGSLSHLCDADVDALARLLTVKMDELLSAYLGLDTQGQPL